MTGHNDICILASEAVQLLREMIAVPSPSFSEDAVCTLVSEWMKSKGIIHQRKGNNLIAAHIADPAKPVLMLCAHIDTVEPSPEYDFDPYEPDYSAASELIGKAQGTPCGPDDIVAGLGSNDDGASAVAMTAAYRHLMHEDTNIVLVLTCEEERSGKGGMTGLWGSMLCSREKPVEGGIQIDMAIVGEPTGMKAAISERGLLVIDATAHGVSGHAARNEGCNALYIAMEDIQRLRNQKFTRVSPLMGNVNLNVTQINAGTAHNVIPDRCDFVIDIRPTEQYTNEEILEELQSICQSSLRARNLSNRSSASREDSLLVKAAARTGTDTFSSPTTSDWMRIDCDAVKMGPGESSRSHRKNEFVFVREIEEGIRKYIEFIKNINF